MLAQYFGFREEPFGATPDPRWLYRSAQYREALESLRYGFYSNRGFSVLIAPPGLGKTTLLYQFLHDIRNSARIIFLFDTQCGPLGLLRYILRDLGIAPAINCDEMHVQLEAVLVKEARAGRTVVVVVDEAQNLSDEALEMLRLLTNYETPRAKSLHIVLSGQPALAETLTKPSMEQLRQRVTSSCWLEPFSIEETIAYIRHLLEQAGYRGAPLFRKDALRRILYASHGVPRIINNLSFNALSLCRENKLKQVDGKLAAEAIAIQELDPESRQKITDRWKARSEPAFQPELAFQPERPPKNEDRVELARPDQVAGPKPVLRVVRLTVAAAAVLLVASGIVQFTLPARWQPWSRLTGYMQSLDKKIQSLSCARTSKANVSTENAAARPSKPLPVNTDDLPASIPAPAKANMGGVTITEASARTKPSLGKSLSRPSSAPPRANVDRVNVAEAPSKTTLLASTVVSPPIPAPAVVNTSKKTVEEPASKAKSFQITAEPNQTLREVSVRYLSVWDLERLREIQALNPQLTDLEHLQVGQKIWLPAPEPTPVAQPSTAQEHLSRVTGAGFEAKEKSKVALAGFPIVSATTWAGSYGKVASAGIPNSVRGAIPAKTAVAPVPAEMLSRPTLSSNPAEESTPNCGGITEIPCPTLHVRTTEHPD